MAPVRDQGRITGPELAATRRDFSLGDVKPEARAAGAAATVAEETPEFPVWPRGATS